MKLRVLRAHYVKKPNNILIPKQGFTSIQEIKEKMGDDPRIRSIYKCDVCHKLHVSKRAMKDRV